MEEATLEHKSKMEEQFPHLFSLGNFKDEISLEGESCNAPGFGSRS